MSDSIGNAWQVLTKVKLRAQGEGFCECSAGHAWKGIPATTVIDCGPVGEIPACDGCAAFYQRMS